MEDFKWIVYVLAVVYLIFKSLKKKSPNPNTDYKPLDTNQPSSSKPVTFEDLLREIQQSKASKPEAKPATKPVYNQPKYIDYDDDVKAEEEDLEDVDYNYRKDDDTYKTYEKAKSDAFNKPSYEEVKPEMTDSIVRFNPFKEYDVLEVPSYARALANELRNPESIKKAVILSEILNRRY